MRYRGEIGPGKATANLGYADSDKGDDDRIMASAGYKLNMGLSFAYSWNQRTQKTLPDIQSQLFSLNYQYKDTIFSVDYGDQSAKGSKVENEVKQIGFQHNASKQLALYGAYTLFDNADGTKLDAFFVGARYAF